MKEEKLQKIVDTITESIYDEGRFIDHIGLELLEVKLGYAKGKITVNKAQTNPVGYLHGGCAFTMLDTLAGIAANTHGKYVLTTTANLCFLQAANLGETVIGEAIETRHGKTLGVYDVKLYDKDNTVLASGIFHFYKTPLDIVESTCN